MRAAVGQPALSIAVACATWERQAGEWVKVE